MGACCCKTSLVQPNQPALLDSSNSAKDKAPGAAPVISQNGEHFYRMTLGFLEMKKKLDEVAETCLPRAYMVKFPSFKEEHLMYQTIKADLAILQQEHDVLNGLQKAKDRPSTMEAVYEVAEDLSMHWESFVRDLGSAVGLADEQIKLAPLKGQVRAREKVRDDYSGNWRKLVDVNRASLIVSSEEQLVAIAEFMANTKELQAMSPKAAEVKPSVLQLKNRFKHALFNGYRDALYSVQLMLPGSSLVFVCELQVHLDKIIKLKKESHVYYEFFRSHFAGNMEAVDDRMRVLMKVASSQAPTLAELVSMVSQGDDLAAMEALEEFLDLTAELDALAHVRARRLAVLKAQRADAKEVLALQMKLGSAHDQAGRIDEALRIFTDAYATYKADDSALLELHVEDFCSLCNSYGWASYEKGSFDQAEQLYDEALHGYRVKLNQPKHERALATLGGIALLRQDAGRIDEALVTYGEALALKREMLGPDNISTLTTMTFMAGALRLANRKDEASAMASEAYKMRKALLGSDHPDTIIGACELAALSEKGGEPEEALVMYEEALNLQLVKLGPDHPATLKTTAALEKLRTKLGLSA
jgi:tetratricopeptide (TPR) repeat protein